ncbi:MAG: DUF3795 domain-containing protein [Bacteroidales bacterium]
MNIQTNQKISFCGDVCTECPRYVATIANDNIALKSLAELWFKLGFRPKVVDPEEIKCLGCSKEMACSNGINDCEHLETIMNCGECDNFPCEKINAVFEKTDTVNKTCKDKCTEIEYNGLRKAFFMKRQILTEINRKHRNKNK